MSSGERFCSRCDDVGGGQSTFTAAPGSRRSAAPGRASAGMRRLSDVGDVRSPTGISPTAQRYLNQLLDVMQANSINRKTIDWPVFRQTIVGVDANLQTIQDL